MRESHVRFLRLEKRRDASMNWQIESISPTAEPVFSCGRVMVLREMQSALASIYKNGAQLSASGAAFPDAPSSIPNIGAEFPSFTSKSVEVWPNLPPSG
jgi:hypothetical protein